VFKPHPNYEGQHGLLFFPNGYGISVVRFKLPSPTSKDGFRYGSYTSNDSEYEVAVLKGDENDWDLCYTTEIGDDVIGHQIESEVDYIMYQIQELEPCL
jgi:hypothetical protein